MIVGFGLTSIMILNTLNFIIFLNAKYYNFVKIITKSNNFILIRNVHSIEKM